SFTYSDITPPELLLEGVGYQLDGTIKSQYTMTSLTAGIYLANNSPAATKTVSLSAKSYALSGMNSDLNFAILPPGQYIYRVTATNTVASNRVVVESPFTVLASTDQTMTLSGANYPAHLEKGASYSIRGIITSTSNLYTVTVAIYNALGARTLYKTMNASSTVFTLKDIDTYIKFGNLAIGSYTYRVLASNATSTEKVLLNVAFKVVDAATLTYVDWKKDDARWGEKRLGSSSVSMAKGGNVVTALAMLAVQTGVRDATAFHPGALCDALSNNGGFDSSGNIKWTKVTDVLDHFTLVGSNLKLTGTASQQLAQLSDYVNATHQTYAVLLYAGGSQWVACKSLKNNVLTIMDPSNAYTNWLSSYSLEETTRIAVYEVTGAKTPELPITGTGEYATWTQSDPRWGSMTLGTGKTTMAASGCVVTSLAMLAVHYGLQNETTFNPGTLLQSFNTAEALTSGGSLYWNMVDSVLPGIVYKGKADLTGTVANKASALNNYMAQGYAVLINVNRSHWVALRYVSGDIVSIFDPASPQNSNLFTSYTPSGVAQVALFRVSAVQTIPVPAQAVLKADSDMVRLGETFTLNWVAVSNSTLYHLRVYNSKGEDMLGNTAKPYLALTDTTYSTAALPADRYTAVVHTFNISGSLSVSSVSEPYAFTIYASPVERIAVQNITHHSADISWRFVENAASYNLYVNGIKRNITPIRDTAVSLYGLVAYSAYSIEIRAVDETGEFSSGTHPFHTLAGNGNMGLCVGDTILVDGIANTAYDGSGENQSITGYITTLKWVDGSALNPFGFYWPTETGTLYFANSVVVTGASTATLIVSDLGILPDGYVIPDNDISNANIVMTPVIAYTQGYESMTLTLSVSQCSALEKLALRISYDEELLTFHDAIKTDHSLVPDSLILTSAPMDGSVIVTIGNASLIDASGELITLVFTVNHNKKGDAAIAVAFSSLGAFASNTQYPVCMATQNIPTVARDINGDGFTDQNDVDLVFQEILGKTILTPQQMFLADMDQDNRLTNRDLVLLKRYIAMNTEMK
ncbi:MAG TPA: hypothetical protein DER23_04430, partial [Clostridiales bacterium]|nr:hypothetical protein [Clostridiales bacterium]